MGYTGYGSYFRFVNVDEKLKKEIINYLKDIPQLYWIGLIGGKFDIVFGIMSKSSYEFNKIYYEVLNKYGKHLADNTIAIRTELRQNKRNYLTNDKLDVFVPPFFGKEPELEQLDELDSNILSLISNNARMNVVEISKLLSIPPSTVSLRIKNMEKRGLIQAYTTYIKSQHYGKESYRLFLYLQNMDNNARNRLFAYAYNNPNMVLAIETLGKWNFEITLQVDNHNQLQDEISILRNEFSDIINNIEFIIMFEDDLIYDPYPLKKIERKKYIEEKPIA